MDFEKQCRLLEIDINSPEAENLRKSASDANNNSFIAYNAAYTNVDDEVWLCKMLTLRSRESPLCFGINSLITYQLLKS